MFEVVTSSKITISQRVRVLEGKLSYVCTILLVPCRCTLSTLEAIGVLGVPSTLSVHVCTSLSRYSDYSEYSEYFEYCEELKHRTMHSLVAVNFGSDCCTPSSTYTDCAHPCRSTSTLSTLEANVVIRVPSTLSVHSGVLGTRRCIVVVL